MKIGDDEALYYARRLTREEGFLCGGSSGTAMAACMKYIKEHNIGEGKRFVIVCPDNIRNYITKHINNDWMYEKGLMTEKECMEANIPKLIPHNVWGKEFTVADLDLKEAIFIDEDMTCKQAIQLMQQHNCDQFPVRAKDGKILGMVKASELTTKLGNLKLGINDCITGVMNKEFRHMSSSIPIPELTRIFEKAQFVLVDNKYIASHYDLLTFMSNKM